jgi:hypothetical protein
MNSPQIDRRAAESGPTGIYSCWRVPHTRGGWGRQGDNESSAAEAVEPCHVNVHPSWAFGYASDANT